MSTTTTRGDQPTAEQQMERSEQIRSRIARYRRVFWTFWWIPAITLSVGLAYQGWESLTKPLTYSSVAQILVSGRISLPEGGIYNEEAVNFFGTQQELMQGQEVRRRAAARVQARRPDLTPCAVALAVSQKPRTSIFILQAFGDQPDYVKAYLNAVIEEYIALRRGIFQEKSQSTLTAISQELADVEKRLRVSEEDLVKWKSENNLVFLQEGGDAAGLQLARLNSQLALLESEAGLMQKLSEEQNIGRVASLDRDLSSPDAGTESADFLLASETAGPARNFLETKQRIALMESERLQMLQVRKPAHPKIQELDRQIESARQLLEVYRTQANEQLESRQQSLQAQIVNTMEQIDKWEEKALALGQRMGEFERLRDKVEREKALYDRLLESVQRVDVNSNIQQDILSVMEYATPPRIEIQPLARNLIVGAVGGLAVGVAILLLIAAFDDRVASASELQAIIGEEVVGILPQVPEGQQYLRLNEDDNPGMLESLRKVRSWLLFTQWENGPPKTLMVTSAIPGEGKSTSVLNTAMAFASSGMKTLLVDGDLRRGCLHRLLDREQDPGLGNVLNGETPVEKAVHPTEYANLWLMPRGFWEAKGSEAFMGSSLNHLLAKIEQDYDVILFDSSPALATDETCILGASMDAVLVVVRAGVSSLRLAKKTVNHLKSRGAAVEGIIYNAVNPSSHEYPYYHYYYYSTDRNKSKKDSKQKVKA